MDFYVEFPYFKTLGKPIKKHLQVLCVVFELLAWGHVVCFLTLSD